MGTAHFTKLNKLGYRKTGYRAEQDKSGEPACRRRSTDFASRSSTGSRTAGSSRIIQATHRTSDRGARPHGHGAPAVFPHLCPHTFPRHAVQKLQTGSQSLQTRRADVKTCCTDVRTRRANGENTLPPGTFTSPAVHKDSPHQGIKKQQADFMEDRLPHILNGQIN